MKAETDGVILAAGLSSRAGRFKMALPVGDKSLIQRTVESMIDVCSRLIVVAGYRSGRIIELTRGYANLEVVLNPHYSKGMFTSIQQGVRHVEASWFFLSPGDYPLLSKAVYRELLEARDNSPGKSIFIPVFQGRKGHPVLLSRDLAGEILAEPEDSNLRAVINRNGFVPVETGDDSILLDIDTMEDFQRLKTRLEK